MHTKWSTIADILGKLWASPYTLLGLIYGLLTRLFALLLGAPMRICVGNNAIQFIDCRGVVSGAALTLGNVILYGRGADQRAAAPMARLA